VEAMSKRPLIDQLEDALSRIMTDPQGADVSVDPFVFELLHLARDLRDLPRPDFKAALKSDLERKALMSTTAVTLRPGFRTITPYLLPPGPEFIDFIKRVFDAEETERTETGPGRFHAEFRIGDSMLMVGVGSGRHIPGTFIVYVKNADETYRRALAAGATSLAEITENYGDRFGVVRDAAGNGWCIATYLGNQPIVAQEQLNTITTSFGVAGSARFIQFLKQAFNAEEVIRYDSSAEEVIHAKIRIGNSIVAIGEARSPEQAKPVMIYMYVADCNAMYDQALRAGAKSISPVADQSYGDRHGGVEDGWGNQWYIATPL
jgi:PhnB protein